MLADLQGHNLIGHEYPSSKEGESHGNIIVKLKNEQSSIQQYLNPKIKKK